MARRGLLRPSKPKATDAHRVSALQWPKGWLRGLPRHVDLIQNDAARDSFDCWTKRVGQVRCGFFDRRVFGALSLIGRRQWFEPAAPRLWAQLMATFCKQTGIKGLPAFF